MNFKIPSALALSIVVALSSPLCGEPAAPFEPTIANSSLAPSPAPEGMVCSDQYCTRYMVGTRGKGEERSATNHSGFRCVKD
jgi:hypothetical protein